MTDRPAHPQSGAKPSREERLAAKLRENLRRRKEQARSLDSGDAREGDSPTPAKPDLPKPPATR